MDSLPNELLDNVIKHVAASHECSGIQDTSSLANCCLVSRRFYESANPQLYSAIHLKLMTDEPLVLLNTLKSKVQLAKSVRSLFIQNGAPCATPIQHINELRDFLAGALPLVENLTTFRSDQRIVTIKLVETSLYHNTGGYSMGTPVNLNNIRTLEVFAADYIYKYNYILRLPQLRRVKLHCMKIIDSDGDDRAYPNDWGWSSNSIKELEVHQGYVPGTSAPYRLWSNSLTAFAKSMPALTYLRLYHHECTLYPKQSRQLMSFFIPQLRNSLRRLKIEDGRIDALYPELGYNYLNDDVSILEDIATSHLEYLSIDLHTLFDSMHHMNGAGAIHAACLPPSLRRLHLRYVELTDMSSVHDAISLLNWEPNVMVQELASKLPLLSRIDLEIRPLKHTIHSLLEKYKTIFLSRGILFNFVVHTGPAQRRTSILCSRPT